MRHIVFFGCVVTVNSNHFLIECTLCLWLHIAHTNRSHAQLLEIMLPKVAAVREAKRRLTLRQEVCALDAIMLCHCFAALTTLCSGCDALRLRALTT